MGFIFFKQAKPKQFNYIPRFYDPAKEEREKRRASLGLNTDDLESDDLRTRIKARWHKKIPIENGEKYSQISLIFYVVFIFGGIYVIFFTHLIDNIIKAFGLLK